MAESKFLRDKLLRITGFVLFLPYFGLAPSSERLSVRHAARTKKLLAGQRNTLDAQHLIRSSPLAELLFAFLGSVHS
ncbi:MAG: hypothetical protein JOZ31_12765 [Verrucomicrobia bacterium]|nr:hypothetical protein [Verrucomicrobiota bacterium]MBV8485369.1 hypothetical protein [Verrucomicrobiota bacterium]